MVIVSKCFIRFSILLAFYLLSIGHAYAATNSMDNANILNAHSTLRSLHNRPLRSNINFGVLPKLVQLSRSKTPNEFDILSDDDDLFDMSKKFDDYGHMRFGKRGEGDQFDDYGHMRFGRSS